MRPYELLLLTCLIGLGDGSGRTNLDIEESGSVLIVRDHELIGFEPAHVHHTTKYYILYIIYYILYIIYYILYIIYYILYILIKLNPTRILSTSKLSASTIH